jgi:hypothetical protein
MASTGQTAPQRSSAAPQPGERAAVLDDRPAGERPLFGNQIRWAKQVIAETVEQIRSHKQNQPR